jgi:hypothetical protein
MPTFTGCDRREIELFEEYLEIILISWENCRRICRNDQMTRLSKSLFLKTMKKLTHGGADSLKSRIGSEAFSTRGLNETICFNTDVHLCYPILNQRGRVEGSFITRSVLNWISLIATLGVEIIIREENYQHLKRELFVTTSSVSSETGNLTGLYFGLIQFHRSEYNLSNSRWWKFKMENLVVYFVRWRDKGNDLTSAPFVVFEQLMQIIRRH